MGRRRWCRVFVVLGLLVAASSLWLPGAPQADAQAGPAGTLDPSFDGDGIATADVESGIFIGEAAADAAGRILTVVYNERDGEGRDQVWRLVPSANSIELDPTYGHGGVIDLGLDDLLSIRDLAVRPDGGFVVSGFALDGTECDAGSPLSRPALARFDEAGQLDPSFGNSDGGRLLCVDWDGFFAGSIAQDVVVDSQDRFAMLGVVAIGDESRIAITRGPGQTYTQAPVTAGSTTSSWMYGADGELQIAPNDDITFSVVSQQTQTPGDTSTVLLVGRLDGSTLGLDPTFDGDGFLTEPVDSLVDRMELSVDTDGSPAVAMSLFSGTVPIPLRLLEWAPTGGAPRSDDLVPIGQVARVDDLVHVGNGFVAVGVTDEGVDSGNRGLAIAAYDRSTGSVTGTAYTPDRASLFDQTAVVVGGQVYVGQWFAGWDRGNEIAFSHLTVAPDSSAAGAPGLAVPTQLDTTFGEAGFARFAGANTDQGHAVFVQPDRRIVVGGSLGQSNGFVLRQREDGSLDPAFRGGTFDVPGIARLAFNVDGVAPDPRDGSIIAVGRDETEGDPSTLGAVQRLTPNGAPDPAWAGGEPVMIDLLGGGTTLHDGALLADGRVVVVGDGLECADFPACGNRRIVVARFLPDGTLDPDFGDNGITPIGAATGSSLGRGIAIGADGKLVVTGTLDQQLAIARLDADGSLDSTFGDDGLVLDAAGTTGTIGNDVVVRPDGRIVVAGNQLQTDCSTVVACFTSTTAITAQYLPDGSRDSSFGSSGFVRVAAPGSEAQALVIDPLGRIVVAGRSAATPSSDGSDVLMVRMSARGDLDAAFGTSGTVVTDVDGAEAASAIAVGPDGKIVVAGTNADLRGDRVLTARYEPGVVDTSTLAVEPAEVAFAEQLGLTTSAPRNITVTNTGNVTIAVTSVGFEGDGAGAFGLAPSSCRSGLLAPGARCEIAVTFTPQSAGSQSASLRIDSTTTGTPHRVQLRGTGATPVMALNPGVGKPGSTTSVVGQKFPPGRQVTLDWVQPGAVTGTFVPGGYTEPPATVPTGPAGSADAGTFAAELMLFPKTRTGTRTLLAHVEGFNANVPFLVVLPSVQAPTFSTRG